MKKRFYLLTTLMLALSLMFAGCQEAPKSTPKKDQVDDDSKNDNSKNDDSKNDDSKNESSNSGNEESNNEEGEKEESNGNDTGSTNNPRELSKKQNEELVYLFKNVMNQENAGLSLDGMIITESEYNEIKAFTDELVSGLTGKEVYDKIFEWIVGNIAYHNGGRLNIPEGASLNDPYQTFKHRRAVCYGYSNLMKTMLKSQGIPSLVVSGYLIDIGLSEEAHSWVFCNVDNNYIVSDPTNRKHKSMDNPRDYEYLSPQEVDMPLFENDNFKFSYYNGLSIAQVKESNTGSTVNIPQQYTFEDGSSMKITSINLERALPDNVTKVVLSENIAELGEHAHGISKYSNMLNSIEVSSDNNMFESFEGVLYRMGSKVPYFIPPRMTSVVLRPNETFGKNVVYSHQYVENIIFPDNTRNIGSYAVESCPNLRTVSIPANATYNETNSFPEGVQVIRR